MGEEKKITHVDVPDEAPAIDQDDAGAPEEPLSLADLADSGLAAEEIAMAKEQGLVAKTPEEEAAAKKKADEEALADGKKPDPAAAKKPDNSSVDDRFRILSEGKSPEAIISEIGEKGELNKEQEAVLLASLTQNGQALYWGQKKERRSRQRLEADALTKQAALQKENDDLRAQLAKKPEEIDPLETDEERAVREAAEAAANVDPRKKPLTIEDLERLEKEKADKAAEEQKLRTQRADEIKEALNFQQEDAKKRYADFDEATEKVADILRAANSGTLEKLYEDPKVRSRVFQKCRDLLLAYAKADTFEEGDFNAADMTYELAKEHPDFGAEPRNNAPKKGETDADGNPESARRVISNANRRGSSATLNGGGSRRVSLEELTPEQARRIPTSKWNKLPKETREKLLGKA